MKYEMLLFIILLSSELVYSTTINSTLKIVHVVFRHGSRIPDESEIYPNDPYYEVFKLKGFGQLTNKGKLDSYQLGKVLRNKYNNFLGADFQSDMVLTQSTSWDRTKMTALLVLAGLFPPSENDKWNKHLNWNPIPYAYDENNFDLRRPNAYCPAYVKELQKVFDSFEVKNLVQKYNKTFELANHYTGKIYKSLRDIFLLRQLLNTEITMKLALPKWTTELYPDINYLATMLCYYENSNTLLRKLNGGRMLSIILDNMHQKIKKTLQPSGRKLYLYSGHEANIINILAALNLYQPHFPNYNAAVCIELHQEQSTNKHFVKLFYIKDVSMEPEALVLADCEILCEYTKFKEIVFAHLPENYTYECDSQVPLG